jgi:hypothetical protein
MDRNISTVSAKVPEVTSRSRRLVNKIVSGKYGQTITVSCCMFSSRKIVSQTFTFPWERMEAELLDGAIIYWEPG